MEFYEVPVLCGHLKLPCLLDKFLITLRAQYFNSNKGIVLS